MSTAVVFLVDSDVLIRAKNDYYAFDICPGFWKGLVDQHQRGNVFSISRVREELSAGTKTDELVQWTNSTLPPGFFLGIDSDGVSDEYRGIMLWAQRHPRYVDGALAKFATGADGWLVAFAKVHGWVVVTNERPEPDSKREIKLPDVCNAFDVQYVNTYQMLRRLGLQFRL